MSYIQTTQANFCELNYHGQKIRWTLARTIRKHWTAVSILIGLINSVYRDIPPPLEIEPATTEWPKLYHWPNDQNSTTEPSHTSDAKLTMVIARSINLNVSCKLLAYSLQRTRSPPGSRLSRRIGNTHLRNYYNLEVKYIDQKIRRTLMHDIWKHWTAVSTLLGLISRVYPNLPH